MGNAGSLHVLSKEDVAAQVTSQGRNFEPYSEAVRDNGVDGEILASISSENELDELFDEVGVTSKLHKKVLSKLLRKTRTAFPQYVPPSVPGPFYQTPMNPQALEAATTYDLNRDSPIEDLSGFHLIAQKALHADAKAIYSGVHLMLRDGVHPLGSRYRGSEGSLIQSLLAENSSHSYSNCISLVGDESVDSVTKPEAYKGKTFTYVGRVVKTSSGLRIGVVCRLLLGPPNVPQEELMADLSRMAEDQLRKREALLRRNASLVKQTVSLESAIDDANIANEEECAHLPSNMFQEVDSIGMPRPPIPKNDLQRVAAVERLGLHNIEPDSTEALSLKRLVAMAGQMISCPIATLSIFNHAECFEICTYLDFEAGVSDKLEQLCGFSVVDRVDASGNAFRRTSGRASALCNYTLQKGGPFVLSDLWREGDDRFKNLKDAKSARAYMGVPLRHAGFIIGTFCCLDFKPRPDFSTRHATAGLENLQKMVEQTIDTWALRCEMERLEQDRLFLRHRHDVGNIEKTTPPDGNVSIVFTDVECSTTLWEQDAAAMEGALKTHDAILRRCCAEANGYEITTEGDAFQLAFHDPVDAISFALQAQVELYQAAWSDAILALPQAAVDPFGMQRGLRVRMGIHHGEVSSKIHEVTGQKRYMGQHVMIAKGTEEMCHGGQILVTIDAWRLSSGLAESLGSPQVLDIGEHVLTTGKTLSEGVIAKKIVQLVPKSLAFDYSSARRSTFLKKSFKGQQGNRDASLTRGRQFAPPITKRKMSASFCDAPCRDGQVTIAFIYSPGLKELGEELAQKTISLLGKLVRSDLSSSCGYECKEDRGTFMLAFDSMSSAGSFALSLRDSLETAPFHDSVKRDRLIKVGIYTGPLTSMEPNPITGRADYFGTVVNRAARVASAARTGDICIGVMGTNVEPPSLEHNMVSTTFLEVKELKGVTGKVSLFSCSWAELSRKRRKLRSS